MNPLDKIFFDKLKDHEISPSERANKLFEESIQNQKKSGKKPFVYLSMAASIFLLLFTGFWFLKREQKNNIQTAIKTTVDTETSIEQTAVEKTKSTETTSGSVKTIDRNSSTSQFIAFATNKVPSTEKIIEIDNQVLTQTYTEQNTLEPELNIGKTESLAKPKSEFKPEIESIETLVFISPLINAPKVAHNINKLIIIPVENVEQDYFEEDKSLITRFLSEVANLKKGEKVDLTKIGFKTLDEISKDDESFIASETKQIKKGYNWIKSKISNN